MDVREAIEGRRAYRALEKFEVTEELVDDLASAARLAPSCNNNQPWRYVLAYDPAVLSELHGALSDGNRWAREASLIVAVFSKPDDDCVIKDRVYNNFDVGLATAFMILQATELGLVAHPIAGYSPKKVREVLGIPGEYEVIALLVVGRHSESVPDYLSEKQRLGEKQRPPRKEASEFAYKNRYVE
ncbi:MAG: nitroreductase [Candidatus Altiarchaeales archaeon]|nr:nitroreductase [Candidatus Altiarchaeales archaeon]MBD3416402.1 nitroreductase [Candidatus Altiarchaeales archaeon]